MPERPIYIPTFRSRQQENIVLKEFDFGELIYPMLEIIKPYDRKRPHDKQVSFSKVYTDLIADIRAEKVFVDLPFYLKEKGALQDEVLSFYRGIIVDKTRRTAHLAELESQKEKIIPVVSSFISRTGESDSLSYQVEHLRPIYGQLAFRTFYSSLVEEWDEIDKATVDGDVVIVDFDTISPYPSPTVKRIMERWKKYKKGPVVILRSAINTDISNVGLEHGDVVFDVDNGLIDMYKNHLNAQAFGDYAGIKKDDLTSGGTISPGFLLYNPVQNNFTGFKGSVKELGEFEHTIVPAILESEAVSDMRASNLPYLEGNPGWDILMAISEGKESGKSQAKFKKIAMLHYLHCIKARIEAGEFDQEL